MSEDHSYNKNYTTESDIAIAEKEKLRVPSQYNVVMHNNDITSYEEVIIIVTNAFGFSSDEALRLAHHVNDNDKAICGTFSKEIAEMKLIIVDTVKKALAATYIHRASQIMALKFTIEKA